MISQPKHQTFKVFVRCRPLNEKQNMYGCRKRSVNINQPSLITLMDVDGKQNSFNFDYVFNQQYSNQQVFSKTVKPLIKHIVNGYNSTVFAYGITGAGKSFTMFGNYYQSNASPGLIPLTFSYLLNTLNLSQCKLKMSYIQIYNEQIFDLLKDNSQNLQIIQDPEKGVLVMDLQERKVSNLEQVSNLIIDGNNRRVMAQTNANDFSSRSHAIVLITLQRKIQQKIVTAKLSLVDLAGSQKASVHEGKGIRTLEGSNINKSLLALGNCINLLSENSKKNGFVPYRDSKLTRLLKDSLGGNTKTVMIACISQSNLFHDETLNTLKYAGRAKKIQKIVHQNIKQLNNTQMYKDEIDRLKRQNQLLKLGNRNTTNKLKQKKNQIQSTVNNLLQILKDGIYFEEQLKVSQDANLINMYNNNLRQKQNIINFLINIAIEQPPLQAQHPQPNLIHKQKSQSPKLLRAKSAIKQKQNKLPLQLQQMRSRVKKANRYISNLFDKGITSVQLQSQKSQKNLKAISQTEILCDKESVLISKQAKNRRQQLIINHQPCILLLDKSMKRSKHLDSLVKVQRLRDKFASSSKLKPKQSQKKGYGNNHNNQLYEDEINIA